MKVDSLSVWADAEAVEDLDKVISAAPSLTEAGFTQLFLGVSPSSISGVLTDLSWAEGLAVVPVLKTGYRLATDTPYNINNYEGWARVAEDVAEAAGLMKSDSAPIGLDNEAAMSSYINAHEAIPLEGLYNGIRRISALPGLGRLTVYPAMDAEPQDHRLRQRQVMECIKSGAQKCAHGITLVDSTYGEALSFGAKHKRLNLKENANISDRRYYMIMANQAVSRFFSVDQLEFLLEKHGPLSGQRVVIRPEPGCLVELAQEYARRWGMAR